MIFESRANLLFAVCLSFLAGFNDAVGFSGLGGFFVSFMSGNSTRLGVNLAEGVWRPALLLPLGLIALFVAGVVAGALTRRGAARKDAAVLALVAAALLLAALTAMTDWDGLAFALMVMAMGASNNVFVREGEVSIGVTYMTGTLVKLGQRLAANLARERKPYLPYLVLWAGLVAGAVAGAASYAAIALHCLWIAAAFATLLLTIALRRSTTPG